VRLFHKFAIYLETSKLKSPIIKVFVLIFLGALWGSSFILIKKSLKFFESYETALIRICLSFFIMAPFVIKYLKKLRNIDIFYLIAAGVFGNGLPVFLWAAAQKGLDSSFGGLINSTTPIFTLLISSILIQSRLSLKTLTGIFVGSAGTIFLFFSAQQVAGKSHFSLTHALWGLAGSACYGISLNLVKQKLQHIPAHIITGIPFIFMGIIALLVLIFWTDSPGLIQRPGFGEGFIYLTALAGLSTCLGAWIFNLLIKETSALFASTVTYLIPCFAVIWSVLGGEPFYLFILPSLILIISGIILVQTGYR